MGESRVAYRVSAGKPQGKRLVGTPRLKCENNIRICLKENV
jgi:hypothetical protein